MKILTKLAVVTALTCSAVPYSAIAFDYNKTINLAGKQRMLTQKMSKEALLVALDVNKAKNAANLQKTHDLFDKTLKGLKDGDTDLGLDKTKKPKIRKQLEKVEKLWKGFSPAIVAIAKSGSATKEQIATIASSNMPLLKAMNKGVKFYEADATGSGTNPALAKAINLAGKQRMLTQKMSKEFFLAAYGNEADSNTENLAKTITLFDTTLTGLIEGDASVGLSAAPSDEIKAQLEKVKGMWTEFRPVIEGEPTDEAKKQVEEKNLPLLKEMNAAVKLFEKL